MEIILSDIAFGIVGWLYMWIKYRDAIKLRNVLKEKYENKYSNVGRNVLLSTFLVVIAISILTLVIVTIGYAIF